MIKILGFKRIILIAALIGTNLMFAGVLYGYMKPKKETQDKTLRTVKAQVSNLRSDISRMQIELQQLEQQKDQFELLKDEGFFDLQRQSRRVVEKELPAALTEIGVSRALTPIGRGVVESSDYAEKAKHIIVATPVVLNIGAIDDITIYKSIGVLENSFPGHIMLDSISMRRVKDINGPLLRSVVAGENPELVNAEIQFTWRTMIPEDINTEE